MSNAEFSIGIDLGTSTSEICVYRHGEPHPVSDLEPTNTSPIVQSIVGIDHRGNLVIGTKARSLAGRSGTYVIREVKRQMGEVTKFKLGSGEYLPEEISALILKQLKQNAEVYLGEPITDVVLTVPANFSNPAREATLRAGQMAGLNVVRLLNEPTAAAMAFGIRNLDAEEQMMVFDFGGGTLDITILEMMNGVLDVKHSYGDPKLGGKDFDEVVVNLIIDKFKSTNPYAKISEKQMESLKNVAEEAKVSLSHQQTTAIYKENIGVDSQGMPLDLDVIVSREEFEAASRPLLDRAKQCIDKILKDAKCSRSSLRRVLLVGGTTYIPAVRALIEREIGVTGKSDVNPMLAVSIGAAVEAAILADLISPEQGLIKTDVTSFGLGIDVLFEVGDQLMVLYDELIPPQKTIPYDIQRTYHLVHCEQQFLEITLFQDHSTKSRNLEDKQALDTITIEGIPPSTSEIPHEVEVTFSYDSNGIVQLQATLPDVGLKAHLTYAANRKYLPAELKKGENMLSRFFASKLIQELQNEQALKQAVPYLKKAAECLDLLSEAKFEQLVTLLEDLKRQTGSGDNTDLEGALDNLIDFLLENEV